MGYFDGVLKKVEIKKELQRIIEEVQENPYYRRIDMPKSIFIRVDSVNDETEKVSMTNQYTSFSMGILEFCDAHEHLDLDEDIEAAKDLLEGK